MSIQNSCTRSPSYLVRTPYSYCFRMKVPPDLQACVGRKELRYSLKTGSLSDAKYKARLIAGLVQWLFRKLKHINNKILLNGRITMELTASQVQEIIREFIQTALDDSKDDIIGLTRPLNSDEVDEKLEAIDYIHPDMKRALGTGDLQPVYRDTEDLLGKRNIQFDKSQVTMFSLFAEIERDLISERTKEGLRRAKAQGKKLGRPKGSKGVSKLDGKDSEIKEYLKLGVTKANIAKILGVGWSTLNHYIKTRGLGEPS